MPNTVRVAAVQAASVMFDREASLQKAVKLIDEAAAKGAKYILFPEAFIPGYPRGLNFGGSVGYRVPEGRKDWRVYWENSVIVPGPTTEALGEACKKNGVYLTIGVIERETEGDQATVYCTILYFGPDGTLLGKHRKLKPTGSERTIWGEGDGSTLTVINTPYGNIGGLICRENYIPLARAAMYEKGISIWCAPTANARPGWIVSMQHIALENRCFVIGANQYVTKDMYPTDLESYHELDNKPDLICRGATLICNPKGEIIAGPVVDGETILVADLNLDEIAEARFEFSVTGHYALPNVFHLIVNTEKKKNATFIDKSKLDLN